MLQNGAAALEDSLAFLKMLNIELPCDPAIPLLGIYLREMKAYVPPKNHTQMFIAAVFVIAKKQKQPKCGSTNEWINEMWFNHTMEYYSTIKTNEILIHAVT